MTDVSIADAVKKDYVNDTWSFKRSSTNLFLFFITILPK